MQKIKDFETFAAGFFIAKGVRRPQAKDITRHCIASRDFAAALSFYLFTNPLVLAKETLQEKYEAVAKNVAEKIND